MEMVQAVVQLYTILGGQEKDDVVVQGHQSFQLLVGKENESWKKRKALFFLGLEVNRDIFIYE